ncbi:MAG TPA: diguanylate cyclase [Gemmatimonadaceae bacterium]|nr:diguanylate cyclase [Gemmatimonadaceae bacterium]
MTSHRIHLVESDQRTSDVLCWLLREQGYAVDSSDTTGAVLTQLDRNVPDLVLLDAQASGVESIAAYLRADDRYRDVRVIVATNSGQPDGDSAPAVGADDWVTKPFRPAELVTRVRAQLRTRRELIEAREAVTAALEEIRRAQDTSLSHQQLVDILHDVTGELTAAEIYRVLTRRVARALGIAHCSVILAHPGDTTGTIVAAFEDPSLANLGIQLEDYPEVVAALESERAVLIEESSHLESLNGAQRRDGREPQFRSALALPFTVDRQRAGVLFIQTELDDRALTGEDAEFAELVLRAAVAAIRRAQALETTRADNRRLEALATTDPLTRVLNRRALVDRLSIEVDRARRFASTLTLLLIDVDYFKLINDTAGHLAGDDVLKQLAALLADAVRRVDIVARYGGEEFVLILPETSLEGGLVFAERLRERVASRTFDIGAEQALHLTVSVGVATFPSARVESVEDLFARGDEALYRAKSGGRNLVRI